MNVVEFSTCIKIEGTKEDVKAILNIMDDLTAVDYDGILLPLGYSADPTKGVLKIPKGYTIPKLRQRINIDFEYEKIDIPEPERNDKGWLLNKTPYEYQDTIKTTILRAFERGETQYIIDLIGGKGKTLTSLFIASELNVPTLIIAKSTDLIKQWVDGLLNKSDLTIHDIYQLKGAGSINYVESMNYTHPIYIATHATIRSIISNYGYVVFNKMLRKMGVGLKIIDEFDTEFKNIMDIDLNSAIRYNMYLTATVYKNNSSEDKVFQNAFKSVKRIGGDMFKHEKPNRRCEWVKIKSHPSPEDRNMVYNYKEQQFNNYRYCDYLFHRKRNTVLIPMITPYIEDFRDNSKKEATCVIYCEKKEACSIMAEILITHFNISSKDIGIINSDIDEYNKKENLKKKYICSTAKSMGRGTDITSTSLGINLEQYAGESIFEQQVYRLGRIGADEGLYVNFVDCSYTMIENYNVGKLDHVDELFKEFKVKYFNCETKEYVSSIKDL